MRRIILSGASVITVIVVAFLVLGLYSREDNHGNKPIDSISSVPLLKLDPNNVIATTASDPITLPMYPGGKQLQVENIPEWSKAIFQTSDPIATVLQFYKTALPGQGWVLTSETTSVPLVSFSWRDSDKITQWKLELDIHGTLSKQAGQFEITLLVTRLPEPHRVPLYEDAQDISRWMFGTFYVSKAKPGVIEEFYKSSLPKDGWKLDPDSSSIDSQGLLFVWIRPAKDTNRIDGGYARITAKPASDERTQVTIMLGGDAIEP